jgi:hypothetical protein
MKAGTVSLHNYLAEHPDVFVGDGATFGEPHFFVAEQNWPRGRGWYESLLDGADGAAAIGEGSPGSTWAHVYRGVPERIAQLIPDARLIYLVRDPSPGCSRCTCIRCRPAATDAAWRRPCSTTATSGRAGTGSSIGAYLDHFDRSQILVIASEVRPPEPGHAVLVTCYRAGYRDTLAPWRSLNKAAAIWARRARDRGSPPGPRRTCGSCGRLPCSSG